MANEKEKQMQREQEIALFENQKIVEVGMEREVKKSFIEYSMSVIMARALPDVRDGMKPGARRILYAMYEDGLVHSKPFRKSATTVGNVLGRYHPHGDAAVYGTMVRMAQDFSMRYPLIEGHGNFGSVDGDGAAAYRYTEARLDKIADEMMRDLDKNVVPMMPNFDNRMQEPTVLPSRFPNLLVNGSMGIAVGMATNIPPHNLREVIDATIYRMDHPDCTVDDLMEYIKGPDFPTRATIYGVNGIKEAYLTGKGHIMVRSRATVEEDHRRIIFTEIPYGVNKSMLCEAIANCAKEKRIEGITDVRDESGRDGMRIVVEYRRDINSQILLNQLYKYTQLQDTFAVNMLALVNNEPKILNLPAILDHYIAHQEQVITRRTEFELEKAKARAHIYEGYKIAIDNIDEIVQIMKTSPSIPESKLTLMERFGLSEIQAQAIVEMTLGKLTGMERSKIEEELARLHKLIAELEEILADVGKIKQIIKDEMSEIHRKYGDERRTDIVPAEHEIILEDLIERHNCVITLTNAGYIKRQPASTYAAQNRGGKGIIGMSTKEEDYIETVLAVNSHSYLMMFTNTGKVQMRKAYLIPEAGRTSKGQNIVNILELEEGEKITSCISVDEFTDHEYLTMVTRNGVIKRTLLSEYEYQRKGGKIALTLDEGDELLYVVRTDGNCELMIATEQGQAIRFAEADARVLGRTARGVRGITLREGDRVKGVCVVEEGKDLLCITDKGFGKRSPFDNFRTMKHRGGQGVTCYNLTEKSGGLTGIAAVDDTMDIMMITDTGTIIRTPVEGIPCRSRAAGGVIVMRLGEGQSLVNFTVVAKNEESETNETEDAETLEEGVTATTLTVEGMDLSDTETVEIEVEEEPSETEENTEI